MSQGLNEFRSTRYTEAVASFRNAVSMNPGSANAHAYLGTALTARYIPGMDTANNLQLAEEAAREFRAALAIDPNNVMTLQSLASLSYNGKRFDEATPVLQRILEIDPKNKSALYTLGVIGWTEAYAPLREARQRSGMQPADPGPLRNENERAVLRTNYGSVINDAVTHLSMALEIDPAYDDAMAYLNLVYREKADLEDSPEQAAQDIAKADDWMLKALQTRKERAPVDPISPASPAPAAAEGARSHIRVGRAVMAANLTHCVEPVYPDLAREARISGTVAFSVVVDPSGNLSKVQLISGHPLLVNPAKDAVSQYAYKPTLLNGQQVSVISTVNVTFDSNGTLNCPGTN